MARVKLGVDTFLIEVSGMHLPRFRVRTLMFVVWLSALVFVGAVDVLEEYRIRNRLELIGFDVIVDDSRSVTLLHGHYKFYYLGPIPFGPCPTAVFSGVAFVASIAIWILYRRGKKQMR